MIKWVLLSLLVLCPIFESMAQVKVSTDRDWRLAKWIEFNSGSIDELVAVQEEQIREGTITNLLRIMGAGTKDAQPYWKPGVPEYDEARAVLLRTLNPIFTEQFSGIHSLVANYSPDYSSFSDIEVDSLYTFADTFPKERWATMNRCSVGLMVALTLASSNSASKSVLDDKIKELIPNPKDCNPSHKEGEIIDAFIQTSAHQKLVQANARLIDPQFRKQLIKAVGAAIDERFKSEVLPEIIPVLRKFVARIRSEALSSKNKASPNVMLTTP